MKTKIRKIFDDHVRLYCDTVGPSLTVQDAKDECDINYIIESYVRRGITPPNAGSYMDCTSVQDYETACMLVAEAKSNFETLPLKMREEFKTVENYLSYIGDESNLKDCLDRGLIDKATVPEEKLNEIYKISQGASSLTPPLNEAENASNAVSEGPVASGEIVSANS